MVKVDRWAENAYEWAKLSAAVAELCYTAHSGEEEIE